MPGFDLEKLSSPARTASSAAPLRTHGAQGRQVLPDASIQLGRTVRAMGKADRSFTGERQPPQSRPNSPRCKPRPHNMLCELLRADRPAGAVRTPTSSRPKRDNPTATSIARRSRIADYRAATVPRSNPPPANVFVNGPGPTTTHRSAPYMTTTSRAAAIQVKTRRRK